MRAGEAVTRLLIEWKQGNQQAIDLLVPIVYDEMRRIAQIYLRDERVAATLQPTALVHEAYLRLIDADVAWNDRVHFYAVSARILRRILVDHAKSRNRHKRGGEFQQVALEEAALIGPESDPGMVELDEALQRLALQDQRKSELIELLFFGGLTYDEAAAALNISAATVHRELTLAKAWLHLELSRAAS